MFGLQAYCSKQSNRAEKTCCVPHFSQQIYQQLSLLHGGFFNFIFATQLDFQVLPAVYAADINHILIPHFPFEAMISTFVLIFFFRATQTSVESHLSAQNSQYIDPSPATRSHGEAISSFLASGLVCIVEPAVSSKEHD